MIIAVNGKTPNIPKESFVAETAVITGDVTMGEGSNVWYGVVIRGDVNFIKMGKNVNIQDNATIHVSPSTSTTIGDNSVVAHNCMVHGAQIGKNTLIAIGAVVMDNAIIGDNVIIGACSFVPPGKVIPDNSIVMGSPCRIVGENKEKNKELVDSIISDYLMMSEWYKNDSHQVER